MDISNDHTYDLYKDIQARTGGEIYIGVVGPVRTGKSTFVKRFMDVMVLPFMDESHDKIRAMDELPQSSGGKTITTTEPKFIPKEAAKISLMKDVSVKVRLIDCVGYMVSGAVGHLEENTERMVKTPWFEHEIPFTEAAEIGTDKVINDHSTIGFVITTDGSFGEISRENYIEAEEKTILELKKLRKPFLVLVNSQKPYSIETKELVEEIEKKYNVTACAVNCEQLKQEDIHNILEKVLYEFPISMVEFYLPKWMEMLPKKNPMKENILGKMKETVRDLTRIRDIMEQGISIESEFVKRVKIDQIRLADGCIKVLIDVDHLYYYEMLSQLVGEEITGEYELISKLQEFSKMQREYMRVIHAVQAVRLKGYGVVTPLREEIKLETPEVIKHGNKYGVKIKAESPSIHMIRANIETEIAPIVGTEEQAKDLIRYIQDESEKEEGIWETNIFGKTVEQLVQDGITGKIAMLGDECQVKLQDTMQKVVNDNTGGMVCIIL